MDRFSVVRQKRYENVIKLLMTIKAEKEKVIHQKHQQQYQRRLPVGVAVGSIGKPLTYNSSSRGNK